MEESQSQNGNGNGKLKSGEAGDCLTQVIFALEKNNWLQPSILKKMKFDSLMFVRFVSIWK